MCSIHTKKRTPHLFYLSLSLCNSVTWWRELFWWKLYQSYFPAKLHKTVDLDPNRNYLFAAFPHGVLG